MTQGCRLHSETHRQSTLGPPLALAERPESHLPNFATPVQVQLTFKRHWPTWVDKASEDAEPHPALQWTAAQALEAYVDQPDAATLRTLRAGVALARSTGLAGEERGRGPSLEWDVVTVAARQSAGSDMHGGGCSGYWVNIHAHAATCSSTIPTPPPPTRAPGLAASPEASGGVLVICGLVVPLRAGEPVARLVGQALQMELRQVQEDVYLHRLTDDMPDLEDELLELRGAAPRINPRIFPSRQGTGAGGGLEGVPDPSAPRQLALTGPGLGAAARHAAGLAYWKVGDGVETDAPAIIHWAVADVLTRVRLGGGVLCAWSGCFFGSGYSVGTDSAICC